MEAKKIRKVILGTNPMASISGYLLSGVVAVQPFLADEFVSPKRLVSIGIMAIIVAILGRIAATATVSTGYRRKKRQDDYEDHPEDI